MDEMPFECLRIVDYDVDSSEDINDDKDECENNDDNNDDNNEDRNNYIYVNEDDDSKAINSIDNNTNNIDNNTDNTSSASQKKPYTKSLTQRQKKKLMIQQNKVYLIS